MNIPIYSGSSDFSQSLYLYTSQSSVYPSPTPFGFYDNDVQFQNDANSVTNFCARRLGWPIENVELQDLNFWTAFEMAVTVYGNELYAYLVRENLVNFEGMTLEEAPDTFQNASITPNYSNIIRVSEQYGAEAGTGGNVTWYSGSVILTASVQEYDLNQWAEDRGISGSELEIKRVFYQGIPASADYYYGGGIGLGAGWGAFFGGLGGVAGYGAGSNFFVTPLSYNVAAIQEVELGNDILFSAYSFELINNKLKVFPVPTEADNGVNFWFEYIIKSERYLDSIQTGSDESGSGYITNVSNMPYNNPVYSQINSIGRSWIFEYTLAQAKEMLGYVRNKYSSIPIPGAAVTLNGGDLIAAAKDEKDKLIARLREYFDETSRKARLERRKDEAEFAKSELNNVPMTIYIG
jgi:hypothetical protein